MPHISRSFSIAVSLIMILCFVISAQVPSIPLPDGPFTFDTSEDVKIRVVVAARNLAHPWGMAFLPGGDMLVTERPGHVRLLRNGILGRSLSTVCLWCARKACMG